MRRRRGAGRGADRHPLQAVIGVIGLDGRADGQPVHPSALVVAIMIDGAGAVRRSKKVIDALARVHSRDIFSDAANLSRTYLPNLFCCDSRANLSADFASRELPCCSM